MDEKRNVKFNVNWQIKANAIILLHFASAEGIKSPEIIEWGLINFVANEFNCAFLVARRFYFGLQYNEAMRALEKGGG